MKDKEQPLADEQLVEEPQDNEEVSAVGQSIGETLQMIKENVSEDDPRPTSTLTLRKILGGDILTAEMVRRQMWLFVLVVGFTILYVAFRYQCQQDMIKISKMERELKDVRYKALTTSSLLTERCRESRVLDLLKNNKDSLLHIADQPPYIITVEDNE